MQMIQRIIWLGFVLWNIFYSLSLSWCRCRCCWSECRFCLHRPKWMPIFVVVIIWRVLPHLKLRDKTIYLRLAVAVSSFFSSLSFSHSVNILFVFRLLLLLCFALATLLVSIKCSTELAHARAFSVCVRSHFQFYHFHLQNTKSPKKLKNKNTLLFYFAQWSIINHWFKSLSMCAQAQLFAVPARKYSIRKIEN